MSLPGPVRVNASRALSGDQATDSSERPDGFVSSHGSPPAASTTQIPAYGGLTARVNAISLPSGDQAGWRSRASRVNGLTSVPSGFMTKSSPGRAGSDVGTAAPRMKTISFPSGDHSG